VSPKKEPLGKLGHQKNSFKGPQKKEAWKTFGRKRRFHKALPRALEKCPRGENFETENFKFQNLKEKGTHTNANELKGEQTKLEERTPKVKNLGENLV